MKNIYCPVCAKNGKKKLIGRCDENARGVLYLWCKGHRGEVEIDIAETEPQSHIDKSDNGGMANGRNRK